jgi:uncharacterized membrane protein YtjA (UPF0391 family)
MQKEGRAILRWSIVFFVLALAAAVLGFSGVMGVLGTAAEILFYLFLVLFIICLIAGLVRGRRPRLPVTRKEDGREAREE